MSHNYFIRILLNIKDKNISFEKNFISDKIIKKINSKIFHPKLTYKPEYCPCCCNKEEPIIKYLFNKPLLITFPKVSNFNTYMSLKKQRFLCKKCNSTFIATFIFVQENYYISKGTKLATALESKEKVSEKDIARRFNLYSLYCQFDSIILPKSLRHIYLFKIFTNTT